MRHSSMSCIVRDDPGSLAQLFFAFIIIILHIRRSSSSILYCYYCIHVAPGLSRHDSYSLSICYRRPIETCVIGLW